MPNRVTVIREVTQPLPDKDILCLQHVVYTYDDGGSDMGYRFIRRGPDKKLKAQRGQANCVSIKMMKHMIANYEKRYAGETPTTNY